MKMGGMMTAFFMIAGIVVFGIGLYIASAKDEDVIDRVIDEMKSLRADVESARIDADKEKKLSEQFRTDLLLTAAKIEQFIQSQEMSAKAPRSPQKSSVALSGPVTVHLDRPVQVEIISKKRPVVKAKERKSK